MFGFGFLCRVSFPDYGGQTGPGWALNKRALCFLQVSFELLESIEDRRA